MGSGVSSPAEETSNNNINNNSNSNNNISNDINNNNNNNEESPIANDPTRPAIDIAAPNTLTATTRVPIVLNRPYVMARADTMNTVTPGDQSSSLMAKDTNLLIAPNTQQKPASGRHDDKGEDGETPANMPAALAPVQCLNPVAEVNAKMDTQIEVRVYPCNNSAGGGSNRKKCTQFTVKPEVCKMSFLESKFNLTMTGLQHNSKCSITLSLYSYYYFIIIIMMSKRILCTPHQ